MIKSDKTKVVQSLEEQFKSSEAVWLTEYRGLTVSAIKELRKSLGDSASYSVIKNTLASIAAKNTGMAEELIAGLQGPSALSFVTGDAIEAVKALKKFGETNDALVIKGGIFEGQFVGAETVIQLASLESREVLLSKSAGAMKGLLSKAAALFVGVPTKFVGAADALKERKE